MVSDAWTWDDVDGPAKLQRELDAQGWSRFDAPDLLDESATPIALSQRLFGLRPVRLRRQTIEPDRDDPHRPGHWQTTRAAPLHTDGPGCGAPPTALVMYCDHAAREGGDVVLLDTWAVLRTIEHEDPALFEQLLTVPRQFNFGEAAHFGPTFSWRSGHFVCLHLAFPGPGDAIGQRFQAFVDAAPKVTFRPRRGEVYVINNHRCLHGRLAFEDLDRRFVRVMLWFVEPFAAPEPYVERARHVASVLSARLEGAPFWQRVRFGVAAPVASPAAIERLRLALDLFLHPRDTMEQKLRDASEQSELQDTLIAACLAALEETRPPREERESRSTALLAELLAERPASGTGPTR